MATLQTMESSIISFLILLIIYIHSYSRIDKPFTQYKLFTALLQTNLALIVVDILGWIFNGMPGHLNLLYNKGFNLLLYITEPIGPALWILYTNYQVFSDDHRLKKQKRILLILLTINAAVSLISLKTGWFFSVDEQNIYHRGSLFWVHTAFCYGLLFYSLIFIVFHKAALKKRDYYSLLFYYVPQGVGTTIQVLYYGVSFNWTGMMLSLLVIYLNLQERSLHTDYLTGLYNRRQLDSYIQTKVDNSSSRKSFSAILIDLDKFKNINDRFGHKVGDEALLSAVEIINKCVSVDDFVARYGGDEFFIILNTDDRALLEKIVREIKDNVIAFNRKSGKPFEIHLSLGYDIYKHESKMTKDEFVKYIDMLMYNNKRLCL